MITYHELKEKIKSAQDANKKYAIFKGHNVKLAMKVVELWGFKTSRHNQCLLVTW